MTLLVDRRKDNYDDLLMLARDARASRARVNRWTTGLVVGAMTAMGIYVATVNQEVDQLRKAAQEAGAQKETTQNELDNLKNERNALAAQLDAVSRFEKLYAEIAPAAILGDRFKDIAVNVSGGDPTRTIASTTVQPSLSNLVWIVDGSRRFPMTSGDILWVPEGKFWVRMERPGAGKKPNAITIHEGEKPVQGTSGTPHVFASNQAAHRIKVGDAAPRGIADCIKLTYHEKSSRFGFGDDEWVDIEVLFYNNSNCPGPNSEGV
ncbi:MAG: WXG100 family type VII secretion target [Chromatiales bacterium]|nr:MAG: WXG100 family type VII secretion target [Chromatiales bacterium]